MLDTTHTTIDTNDAETHPPSQPRLMATEDAPTDGALERAELALLDVEELLEDALASVGRARVAVDEHHRLASLPVGQLGADERAFIADEYVDAVQAVHWASRRIDDSLAAIGRAVRPKARARLLAAERRGLARLKKYSCAERA
jgi:hypothetical protein